MSKDLAQQQTEWDLHENPESFIPLEFTEEIKPETFGLEISKATEMVSGLSTTLAEREVLKNAYIDVIELPITAETLPTFKELRLKIVKNRTQGIEKWHKTNKAFYLAGGRFVDAVKNKEVLINEEMESKLMDAEKYFENLEKEAKRILNEKRVEIIRPYVDDVSGLDFSDFSDENFDDFVLGKKTRFENDKIIALREKRHEIIMSVKGVVDNANQTYTLVNLLDHKMSNEIDRKDLLDASEEKFNAFIDEFKVSEKDNVIYYENLETENKLLLKELQAKKDAETKAENERLAKIEADKKAADKLLKAGQKKQIESWIETFQIEIPEHLKDNKIANDILSKFLSFKSWAKKETENL